MILLAKINHIIIVDSSEIQRIKSLIERIFDFSSIDSNESKTLFQDILIWNYKKFPGFALDLEEYDNLIDKPKIFLSNSNDSSNVRIYYDQATYASTRKVEAAFYLNINLKSLKYIVHLSEDGKGHFKPANLDFIHEFRHIHETTTIKDTPHYQHFQNLKKILSTIEEPAQKINFLSAIYNDLNYEQVEDSLPRYINVVDIEVYDNYLESFKLMRENRRSHVSENHPLQGEKAFSAITSVNVHRLHYMAYAERERPISEILALTENDTFEKIKEFDNRTSFTPNFFDTKYVFVPVKQLHSESFCSYDPKSWAEDWVHDDGISENITLQEEKIVQETLGDLLQSSLYDGDATKEDIEKINSVVNILRQEFNNAPESQELSESTKKLVESAKKSLIK